MLYPTPTRISSIRGAILFYQILAEMETRYLLHLMTSSNTLMQHDPPLTSVIKNWKQQLLRHNFAPDVVFLFSYIRGHLSIICFYWTCSLHGCHSFFRPFDIHSQRWEYGLSYSLKQQILFMSSLQCYILMLYSKRCLSISGSQM